MIGQNTNEEVTSMTVDPLTRFKDFELSEAHEIVRIVEVVKGNERYRLEVAKSVSNQNAPYDVQYYRWASVMTHGTDESAGDDASCLWVETDLPEAQGKNPDEALTFALSVLP
jgi:hypothetical protein